MIATQSGQNEEPKVFIYTIRKLAFMAWNTESLRGEGKNVVVIGLTRQ